MYLKNENKATRIKKPIKNEEEQNNYLHNQYQGKNFEVIEKTLRSNSY